MAGQIKRVRSWARGVARRIRTDRGMTTSEYAVGTIAACALAAVLYKVVTSPPVMAALQSILTDALDAKV
ncbi:DUF4244 domain-containing protein [Streptomyces sp. NPDC057486]|uniref:DUF4244 domain-containing protein n=1 Tax=Streptomyces sp. NPDC057486 TaxID=3346145 RepID=UPI00369D92B6